MVNAKRMHRRRFPIWVLLLSLTLFWLCACSKDEAPTAAPATDAETVDSAEADVQESDFAESEMDVDELKDLGEPCRDHRYLLAAGTFETLAFSRLLPPGQKHRPTTYEQSDSELDGTGVEVSIDAVYYQPATHAYPVWAFDYSGFMDEFAAEMERRKAANPNARFGVNAAQSIQINGRRLDVSFDSESDYYIIQRLNGSTTPKAVGRLSREAVAEALGMSDAYAAEMNDAFLNRTLSIPLVESTLEEELTFLTYSVSVNTPAEGGIRDTRQRFSRFRPDTGSGEGIAVGVTSSWPHEPDPNALFFAISGPAEDPACYESDAY